MKIKPMYKRLFKQMFKIAQNKKSELFNYINIYYMNGRFYATDSYNLITVNLLDNVCIKTNDGEPIKDDTYYEVDLIEEFPDNQYFELYESDQTKRMRKGMFDDLFKAYHERDYVVRFNPKLLASALKCFEIAKVNPTLTNNAMQIELIGSSKDISIYTLTMGMRQ